MSRPENTYLVPPPFEETKKGNGLGIAAMVVGIIAAVVAVVPLLGMTAFFLGPVAVILGIIGLILKNRKKGAAIAGLILGVVSMIIAGIVTAAVSAGVDAVDKSLNAEHTVEYRVTTDGAASVNYWTGGGNSSEDISKNWKKTVTTKELTLAHLSVIADFQRKNATVTCEILIDGESVSKNSGKGAGANASCSGNTFDNKN